MSVKDRSISTLTFFELNFLKSIFLNIVLRAFIRKLINHEIYKKIIRDITQVDRFLFEIYNFIEKARRSNLEIQKLLNEKFKINEF